MDASMDYNPSVQHIPQAMHERYEVPVVNNPSSTTGEFWPAFNAHSPT